MARLLSFFSMVVPRLRGISLTLSDLGCEVNLCVRNEHVNGVRAFFQLIPSASWPGFATHSVPTWDFPGYNPWGTALSGS